MVSIGYITKVKKFAVQKFKEYKDEKEAEKAIYKEAYDAERKNQIKLAARQKVIKVSKEAREDAKYGGKIKRFIVETAKAAKNNQSKTAKKVFKQDNVWTRSSSNSNNPWTRPNRGNNNLWR
jgi:hypothetical protein